MTVVWGGPYHYNRLVSFLRFLTSLCNVLWIISQPMESGEFFQLLKNRSCIIFVAVLDIDGRLKFT